MDQIHSTTLTEFYPLQVNLFECRMEKLLQLLRHIDMMSLSSDLLKVDVNGLNTIPPLSFASREEGRIGVNYRDCTSSFYLCHVTFVAARLAFLA